MKRHLVYLLFLLAFFTGAHAQYQLRSEDDVEALSALPMEKMYVHASSSLIFPGEYLYFKVYAINTKNFRLSTTSTLAYADLVNPDGVIANRIKLALVKGMAQGDFFINGDLPSGDYTLVVYSNWMKNGGLEQTFRQNIRIINPYLTEGIAAADDAIPDLSLDQPVNSETQLQLQPDQSDYGLRSKVQLKLRNYLGSLGHGNYSLLVRRKTPIPAPPLLRASASQTIQDNTAFKLAVGDSIFLPEQRGELFYGILKDESGSGVADQVVFLSIPGKDYVLKTATTDKAGNFYLYIKEAYHQNQAILQALNGEDLVLDIKQATPLPYQSLSTNPVPLHEKYREAILQHSIQNQLENAFFEVKPDSLLERSPRDPFDGGIPTTFVLDDYTRFNTFEETLVEILNYVGYRSGGSEPDYIRVLQDFETYDEPYNDYRALVLVDGLIVPDHESLKDFNARLIDSIQVVRDPIVFGTRNYQGIVTVHTKRGDFHESYEGTNVKRLPLTPIEQEKQYFRQAYEQDDSYLRVPDFRRILLWEPGIELIGTEQDFSFYTSDIPGTYEIILEGFTSYGKPVSLQEEITVTP